MRVDQYRSSQGWDGGELISIHVCERFATVASGETTTLLSHKLQH